MNSFFENIRRRFKNYEHPVEKGTFAAIANSLDQINGAASPKTKPFFNSLNTILVVTGATVSITAISLLFFTNNKTTSQNLQHTDNKNIIDSKKSFQVKKTNQLLSADSITTSVEHNAYKKDLAQKIKPEFELNANSKQIRTDNESKIQAEKENEFSGYISDNIRIKKEHYKVTSAKSQLNTKSSENNSKPGTRVKERHNSSNYTTNGLGGNRAQFKGAEKNHGSTSNKTTNPKESSQYEEKEDNHYPKKINTSNEVSPGVNGLISSTQKKEQSSLNIKGEDRSKPIDNKTITLNQKKVPEKTINSPVKKEKNSIKTHSTRPTKEEKILPYNNRRVYNPNDKDENDGLNQNIITNCYEMNQARSLPPVAINNKENKLLFNQILSSQTGSLNSDGLSAKPGGLGRNYFDRKRFALSFEWGQSNLKTELSSIEDYYIEYIKEANEESLQDNNSQYFSGYLHYFLTDRFEVSSGLELRNLSSDINFDYKVLQFIYDTIAIDTVIFDQGDSIHIIDTFLFHRDTLVDKNISAQNKSNYLTIPINFSLSTSLRRLRLWTDVGLGLNFLLKGDEWILLPVEQDEWLLKNSAKNLNPFFININLGAGTAYQLTENLEVYVRFKSLFYGRNRYKSNAIILKKETLLGFGAGLKYRF